jgi:hypothetical protein
MELAVFSRLMSSAPLVDAVFRPMRRALRRLTRLSRRTPQGKIYLGEGQPVMLFPVFGGGPQSTAGARKILDDAGFASYDWGLGIDNGPGGSGLNACLQRLEEQVIEVFEIERRPITLVGWGVSGLYVREVAKRASPLVRQVITLGTPFNTTSAARRECAMLHTLERNQGRFDAAVRRRLRQCPPVPCTSIYSESDSAVPWEMCVEIESATSENIKVPAAAHQELAAHPMVLEVVTHRLAQPEDEWQPYDA